MREGTVLRIGQFCDWRFRGSTSLAGLKQAAQDGGGDGSGLMRLRLSWLLTAFCTGAPMIAYGADPRPDIKWSMLARSYECETTSCGPLIFRMHYTNAGGGMDAGHSVLNVYLSDD